MGGITYLQVKRTEKETARNLFAKLLNSECAAAFVKGYNLK